jgi:hypothetical protein
MWLDDDGGRFGYWYEMGGRMGFKTRERRVLLMKTARHRGTRVGIRERKVYN